MVDINKVKEGMVKYLDAEIINKLPGWRSWVFGAGATILLARFDAVLEQVRESPMIKTMGVIDGNMIDVETLYTAFKAQAQNMGAVNISVPFIGDIRIGAADLDLLYQCIMKE